MTSKAEARDQSVRNTAATLVAFKDRLQSALAVIDGGDKLSTFEKVQVGRCRDSLRETLRKTDDAIRTLQASRI